MIRLTILLAFIVIASTMAEAKTIRVAVIDTGYDFTATWNNAEKVNLSKPKLCKTGHYDFTDESTMPTDSGIHGTHVAGLIAKSNSKVDYCLIILKYVDPDDKRDSLVFSNKAFERAIELKVDIINYSGGGEGYNNLECTLIKKALDKGIKIVAAAGNESHNLNVIPYYPAMCDNRVIKAINIDVNNTIHVSSNYGNVPNTVKVVGTNVLSLSPKDEYAILTGTSQSAAIYTGILLTKGKK